jgi:hypothetical protein
MNRIRTANLQLEGVSLATNANAHTRVQQSAITLTRESSSVLLAPLGILSNIVFYWHFGVIFFHTSNKEIE